MELTQELKQRFEAILKPIFPVQSSDNIDAIGWSSLHDIDKEQLIIAMHSAYLLDRDEWVSVDDAKCIIGRVANQVWSRAYDVGEMDIDCNPSEEIQDMIDSELPTPPNQ